MSALTNEELKKLREFYLNDREFYLNDPYSQEMTGRYLDTIDALREVLQRLCDQAGGMIDELPDGEYKGLGGLRRILDEARVVLFP